MANVYTRIARASDQLTEMALELREMLRDGRIDEGELMRLPGIAEDVLDVGAEVADIEGDIDFAKQALTLGRHNTPNNALMAKNNRTTAFLEYRAQMKAQRKAPIAVRERQRHESIR